jgi:hypothetical protein
MKTLTGYRCAVSESGCEGAGNFGILEFCAENLRSLDPKRRSRECISGTSGDPDSARMVAADFVPGAHLWNVWSTDRQPNHGRSL